MVDSETLRFIRQEIEKQLSIILCAETGQNTSQIETIQNLFPGMPGVTDRPVMHPYGYVSRAPQGIINVVARMGSHPGNRIVLGHRDKDRPSDIEEGESAIYSFGGYTVRMLNDRAVIGKEGETETLVVGETLKELLSALLDAIAGHSHPSPGAGPTNTVTFINLKNNYVENDKILAKDGGRF